MVWIVVGIVAGLYLLDLLVRLAFVPLVLRILEKVPSFGVKPATPIEGVESFSTTTSDGLTLQCSHFRPSSGTSRGVIIFCPELSGNRWTAAHYCAGLIRSGFHVIAFDFRNQGDSEHQADYGPIHWLTEHELRDVNSVIDAVKSRDSLTGLPVGIFGVSRGGSAALVTAAERDDILAAACDSAFAIEPMLDHYTAKWASLYLPGWFFKLVPFSHMRRTLTLSRRISQLRRRVRYVLVNRRKADVAGKPVLVIAGARDTYIPEPLSQKLADDIGPAAKLWVVSGTKHNMARTRNPQVYDQRLVEFWESAFKLTPDAPLDEPVEASHVAS